MITFSNTEDLISCWVEAGRPLDDKTIAVINEIQAEIDHSGIEQGWMVFEGQCRICNHEHNIICPSVNDIDNQECGNCGNMTMMEKEIPDWEQP